MPAALQELRNAVAAAEQRLSSGLPTPDRDAAARGAQAVVDQVDDYLRRCFYHPQDVVAFDAGERIISAYGSVRDALTSAAFAALAHAQFRADKRNDLFQRLEAEHFRCSTNSQLRIWLVEQLVEFAVEEELASRLEAA